MEKILTRINSLKSKIESLLHDDFETPLADRKLIQSHFTIDRNTDHISDLREGLPDRHVDRAIALFQRLTPFVETGLFLENCDASYKLHAYFHKGVLQTVKKDPKPSFQLPHVEMTTILQTSGHGVLLKAGLTQLYSPTEEPRAFLVKASSDFTFIFISNLPDPWMKEHMEHLLKSIHWAMGDTSL